MHIEHLRSAEKELPSVPDPLAVRSLKLWYCKFKSLSCLASFRNLERLVIAGYPDTSFEALSGLSKLRRLEVLHFPKATDLAPIESLSALEALSFACLPSWDASGKRHRVQSLTPLCSLPKLSAIELLGVLPADDSLSALAACRGLKSAQLSGYPRSEVERFFQSTGAIAEFLPREAG
jgi:hypothetical protein